MDKRNFIRVNFSAAASINFNGQVIAGDIENLSLHGLFIKTSREIPLNTPLDVTVHPDSNASFNLKVSAVRRNCSGLGMQIQEMGVLSFVHIRNVVALQCDDYDEIISETYKVVRIIH